MDDNFKLLPLPSLNIAPSVEPVDHPEIAQALMDYARANIEYATATLQAEIAHERWLREQAENRCIAVEDQREALRAEVSELRAARIAYASEFPVGEDGSPDTGNIHANIRSLKARVATEADLSSDERVAALCDLSYRAGLKAGWNYCANGDEAGFARSMESTREAVAVLATYRQ